MGVGATMSNLTQIGQEKMDSELSNREQLMFYLGHYKAHIAGAILLLLAVISATMKLNDQNSVNFDEITVLQVQKKPIHESIRSPAVVVAGAEQVLTSSIKGMVAAVNVLPGEEMRANKVVLTLENEELNQQAMNSANEWQKAKLDLQQSRFEQHMKISTVKESLAEHMAKVGILDKIIDSQQKLKKQGIISDIELQKSLAEQSLLKQKIQIAQDKLRTITELYESLLASKAENVVFLASQHDYYRQRIAKLTITAPFDGVVTLEDGVKSGAFVSEGMRLGAVKRNDKFKLEVHIPASKAGRVALYDQVAFNHNGQRFTTNISHISKGVKDGFFHAYADIDNTDLVAGENLNVDVIAAKAVKETVIADSHLIKKVNGFAELYRVDKKPEAVWLQRSKLPYRKNGDDLILRNVGESEELAYAVSQNADRVLVKDWPQTLVAAGGSENSKRPQTIMTAAVSE